MEEFVSQHIGAPFGATPNKDGSWHIVDVDTGESAQIPWPDVPSTYASHGEAIQALRELEMRWYRDQHGPTLPPEPRDPVLAERLSLLTSLVTIAGRNGRAVGMTASGESWCVESRQLIRE